MVIDTHQHLWDMRHFKYPFLSPDLPVLFRNFTAEDSEVLAKANGINQVIVVQTFHSLDETKWLLDLSDKYDFIGGIVGWVDLEDPKLGIVLDQLMKFSKLKGIRHKIEEEPDVNWLIRPGVLAGLSEIANRDLCFDLLVKQEHLSLLPRVKEACPDLRLVIDHAAKPQIRKAEFDGWARSIEEASVLPDLMCKVSGLVTEADWLNWKMTDLKPFVGQLHQCFGSQRLMFGSDWPVCLLAASYSQVLESTRALLNLSPDETEHVFYRNARNFYHMESVMNYDKS